MLASGKNRYIHIFFTLTAVFCGLIWAFTNLGYDGEYQVAMSYRMLKGDKMFLEMWEPHQTSAFLPTALMWLYISLFHTTTGIVLYLQVCGMLIRAGIAYLLYRTLCGTLDKPLSYGMALLYFMVSPKDYSLPEFSNLQLWYSTLLFCSLCAYLKKPKPYLLALSALWLCLEVLAYPSCAIVFLGILPVIVIYSAHKWRDVFIFAGICAGLGLMFLCYFLFTIGPGTFMECITGMLALEPTHTVSGISKIWDYITNLMIIAVVFAVVGIAGAIAALLPHLLLKKKAIRQHKTAWWLLCCAAVMLAGFFLNIISAENRSAYGILLLAIAGAGFLNRNTLDREEKKVYVCGSVIGGLGFIATLILTDHPLITISVPYGLLAVIASLMPLRKKADEISDTAIRKGLYSCFYCLVALLAFRCFYIRTPLSGKGQICSSFSGMAMVRTGPAWGILSNEEGVCLQRDSYPEWKEWIPPGSKVWVVGSVVDMLGYLYVDVEVAGPSTMVTPSYNEAVLEYWRLNPDKYPDVIVAEGYLGELSYELLNNRWLMSWLEEEYRPEYVVEGKYWNYYFRKAP